MVKSVTKLSDIYKAYAAEMQSVLKLSELLLQKQKNSLSGELKTSGTFCEDFIRNLIKTHTPNHIRVTSGYILDPEKKNNDENLPQFDLLLVDNSIPPIYRFQNVDIEVVPVEAVCGVIEIKRHIDNRNINKFIEKLSNSVLLYSGLTKTMPFQPNSISVHNMCPTITSPLIGLISLTSQIQATLIGATLNIIDFIWSIDGFLMLPVQERRSNGEEHKTLISMLSRPKDESFKNITQEEWFNFINDGAQYSFFYEFTENKSNPETVITKAIGWLTFIFYGLCGRFGIDRSSLVNNYYLNP